MSRKNILVVGATGHQGKAVVTAFHPDSDTAITQEEPGSTFHIFALTRNIHSPRAKKLPQNDYITAVQGNLDDPSSIRKVFDEAKDIGGIWGVFCALQFPGLGANADAEEAQGKLVADLALEYGVSVFIFSSAERGGEIDDDKAKLDRMAKVKIERHVRELGSRGLPWTIMRPGFFMENFLGTIGSMTTGVLKAGLKPETKLQLVAVNDIGKAAVAVFRNPSQYRSTVLNLAGDILTISEQEEVYKRAAGRPRPAIPALLAKFLIGLNSNVKNLTLDVQRVHQNITGACKEEHEAGLAAARKACPDMMSYEEWVAHQCNAPTENVWDDWNGVSIMKLLTGKQ